MNVAAGRCGVPVCVATPTCCSVAQFKQGEVGGAGNRGKSQREHCNVASLDRGDEHDAAAVDVEAIRRDKAFEFVEPSCRLSCACDGASSVAEVVAMTTLADLNQDQVATGVGQPGIKVELAALTHHLLHTTKRRANLSQPVAYDLHTGSIARRVTEEVMPGSGFPDRR